MGKAMKIGAIVQARMGSTRLPGKVLLPLPGDLKTVLDLIGYRLKQSRRLDKIIIATTTKKNDDQVKKFTDQSKFICFRGDENDVLDRHYQAACREGLDVVVRIPGDKPCVDPVLVDMMVDEHVSGGFIYTTNARKVTFPIGLEVEVFAFSALARAQKNAISQYDREHVTPFIYRELSDGGKDVLCSNSRLSRNDIRLTLDTTEDYALICSVIDTLGPDFRHHDIVELIEEKPWLLAINKKISQKANISTLKEELIEAASVLRRQEMYRSSAIIDQIIDERYPISE